MRIENVRSHEASNAHKTSHSASSVKDFNPGPAIGLWWNDAKKNRRQQNVIALDYQFITNDCKTPVEF